VPARKRLTMAARCLTTRAGRPVRVPGAPADALRMPGVAAQAALL
jgi:hypothetical protein